jgi:hypothetical protein
MGKRYPGIGAAWGRSWEYVVPFFAFAPGVRKMIYTTDEIDKRFFVKWTPQVHSFVRPRDSPFFRPGRRSPSRRAQGRSRLAAFAATTGLALTAPSTAARWRERDYTPRLSGTCYQQRLWLSGVGDLVAKRGASAESVTGPPDHVLPS